jgi:hypothetical protein
MPIKITLPGLSEARGTLPELPKAIERIVIARMSEIVFDEVERGAARHSKTGALMRSIFNQPHGVGGRAVGHDLQLAPHAKWLNLGTRAHDIRPKDKKALRWVSGNGFVFSKFVRHPGYIGDAYVINAATIALREFSRVVDEATKEAAA